MVVLMCIAHIRYRRSTEEKEIAQDKIESNESETPLIIYVALLVNLLFSGRTINSP